MAESITGKIENTWSQVTFRGTNNSSADHPDNDLCSGYETSVATIANSSPRINSLDPILCYARVRMSNNKKKTNKQTKNCCTYWTSAFTFSLQFMITQAKVDSTVQKQPLTAFFQITLCNIYAFNRFYRGFIADNNVFFIITKRSLKSWSAIG